MGIERQVVSSKMRQENVDFLLWLAKQLDPYEVSFSSLIDLSVSIVRSLAINHEIALNPAALQVLLRQSRLPALPLQGGADQPSLMLSKEHPNQARFTFFTAVVAESGMVCPSWRSSFQGGFRISFAARRAV